MKPKLQETEKEKIREYTAGYIAYLTSYSPKRQQVIEDYLLSLIASIRKRQKTSES